MSEAHDHDHEEKVSEEVKAEKARVVKDMLGNSKLINAADGHDHDGDFMVQGLKAAIEALECMITENRASKKCKHPEKWDFASAPLACFGKTREDLLAAYLHWGVKWEDGVIPQDPDEATQAYNVSKSFRRIEAYSEWMHRNAKTIMEPEMTMENMRPLYMDSFSFVSSKTTPLECVLWILDAGRCIRKIDPHNLLRLMCWVMHAITFDADVQRRGLVFVEDMGFLSFWKTVTMIPMSVKSELDKLSQGASAIKMRKFYFMRTAFWINAMMKMASIFINKKMKARMGFYHEDWPKLVEEVGASSLPAQFGVGGTSTDCRDRFFGHTFAEFLAHHEKLREKEEAAASSS